MQRKGGFTLIETMMAMTMIAVALLALMHAVVSSMRLVEANRQDAVAMNHAREKIAEIESKDFETIFDLYKNHTWIPEMQTGNSRGRVLLPINGSGNLDETRSPSQFINMGFPRDINMDGDATDTNVNLTYRILPIKIVISWETVQGARSVEFNTILTNFK